MIGRNFGQHCPYCDYLNDGYTSIRHQSIPNAGDVSICFNCAGIGVFEPDLSIRFPTAPERAAIDEIQEVKIALEGILKARGLNATFH